MTTSPLNSGTSYLNSFCSKKSSEQFRHIKHTCRPIPHNHLLITESPTGCFYTGCVYITTCVSAIVKSQEKCDCHHGNLASQIYSGAAPIYWTSVQMHGSLRMCALLSALLKHLHWFYNMWTMLKKSMIPWDTLCLSDFPRIQAVTVSLIFYDRERKGKPDFWTV